MQPPPAFRALVSVIVREYHVNVCEFKYTGIIILSYSL